jgi:hypothetical protein
MHIVRLNGSPNLDLEELARNDKNDLPRQFLGGLGAASFVAIAAFAAVIVGVMYATDSLVEFAIRYFG